MSGLEARVERLEEEVGIEAVEDNHEVYYGTPDGLLPVNETTIVECDEEDKFSSGVVVYTDTETGLMWKVDEHSKAHENIDREYGWWCPKEWFVDEVELVLR